MLTRKTLLIFLFFISGTIMILSNGFGQSASDSSGIVTDIDSNAYNTVNIGTQVWMVENLKTSLYNDGTSIPQVITIESWINLSTAGYCWYKNDTSYKATYGALYNWSAVNSGKLCPGGWHVPTDADWTRLTNFLGGESTAGDKLKDFVRNIWIDPNDGANNESGFTALPGGDRSPNGSFSGAGFYGTWWSSTENGSFDAWYRLLYSTSSIAFRYDHVKRAGFSVRCLQNY